MRELTIAMKVFQEIRETFPGIAMHPEEHHNHVDLMMDIPQQAGIRQAINLNLQGDELHFSVGHFWCEWFPCSNAKTVDNYKRAVIGYINGAYRILEHYKGARCHKSELQAPMDDKWSTVATWSTLSWPISVARSQVIVKNR